MRARGVATRKLILLFGTMHEIACGEDSEDSGLQEH
jgi:hypothetical protein